MNSCMPKISNGGEMNKLLRRQKLPKLTQEKHSRSRPTEQPRDRISHEDAACCLGGSVSAPPDPPRAPRRHCLLPRRLHLGSSRPSQIPTTGMLDLVLWPHRGLYSFYSIVFPGPIGAGDFAHFILSYSLCC